MLYLSRFVIGILYFKQNDKATLELLTIHYICESFVVWEAVFACYLCAKQHLKFLTPIYSSSYETICEIIKWH
jgi:hypothetical protein